MRKQLCKRGSIANALMMTVLTFGLLMVAAGASIFQFNMSNQDGTQDGARRLAEAAVQTTIARLIKKPDVDATTLPSLQMQLESYPGGQALLAFDSAQANSWQIPLSVNNLQRAGNLPATTSLPGWGSTVVQPETANLVGVGRYRGQECRVEAVLYLPKCPYVVASSVPILAQGGLQVFGINDPSALANGFQNIPASAIEPGHIVTNADDNLTEALRIYGPGTRIEGDAQSHGRLDVSGATVIGEQRPHAELVPMPQIDIPGLNTTNKTGNSVLTTNNNAPLGPTTLTGYNSHEGDLEINGGLTLTGGVLWVNGSLKVQGGLNGKGAVIANGTIQLDGGGAMTGDGAALVAQGPIQLNGTVGQRTEFRGLIYTEGNLSCRYANISGAVVVNNPDPAGAAYMEQVSMAESQQLASINVPIVVRVPGSPGVPGMQGFPPTLHANLPTGGDPYGYGVGAVTQYLGGTGAPTLFTANMNGPREDYTVPPAGYPVTHQPTPAEPWYEIGVPNPFPSDPVTLGSIRINNPDPNGSLSSIDNDGYGWQSAYEQYTDRASARSALIRIAQAWGSGNAQAATDAFLDAADQKTISEAPQFVQIWNYNSKLLGQSNINNPGQPPTPGSILFTNFSMDLSQFFKVSDRIRVLSWREI